MTKHSNFKQIIALVIGSITGTIWIDAVNAQIVPDTTLGAESSVVTPTESLNKEINGGAIRGSNLFHSFREFNVNEGQRIDFTNPSGIKNIFSRVTGNNRSSILGTLGVLGNANLFLLNPNGIIFGVNAQLDLRGSFVASTASSIKFADGTEFSTTDTQNNALLTVSIPIGLQLRANPGTIIVQGSGSNLTLDDPENLEDINRNARNEGLTVQPGKTLALIGGDLILERGNLTATSGQIELWSVNNGQLSFLEKNGQITIDNQQEIANYGDIKLMGAASIDASGAGGGDIRLQGRNITLQQGSAILTITDGATTGGNLSLTATESIQLLGSQGNFPGGLFVQTSKNSTGNGGNLTIDTGRLILQNGAQISTSTFGAGQGGNSQITALEFVEAIGGPTAETTTTVSARVYGTGAGGNLTIDTDRLSLQQGAQVSMTTRGAGQGGNLKVIAFDSVEITGTVVDIPSALLARSVSTGNGGNVSIETERLVLQDGGQIETSSYDTGRAGNIQVSASDSVKVIGGYINPSAIFAQSTEEATGNSGNLTINTNKLILQDGAQISTSTFGVGNAGNLQVSARNFVNIIGSSDFDGTSSAGRLSSGLFAQSNSEATGDGGNLRLDTRQLIIEDGGRISVRTLNTGRGGQLQITAQDSITVSGQRPDGVPSFIISGSEGSGDAGSLTINTGKLIIRDGAEVTASSVFPERGIRGTGRAGDLDITAQSIELNNRGRITAATAVGDRGNIRLQAQTIILRHNSNITTNAIDQGNGGNIIINTDNLVALENSDINANSQQSFGGQVRITTVGSIFRSFDSDITATSAAGPEFRGNVELNTPDTDPSRGIVQLPETTIDPNALIAQNPCQKGEQSKFIITRRGSLPPSVNEDLTPQATQVNLIEPVPPATDEYIPRSLSDKPPYNSKTHNPIVPAQGWVLNNNGEVILTSYNPSVPTTERLPANPPTCSSVEEN